MIETHLPFRRDAGLTDADAREAARLLDDGLLVPVLLDVVVAADAAPGRDLRGAALRLVVAERLWSSGAAVAQEAAAWLWAGGVPPRYVDVVIAPGRVRSPWPYVLVHERRMPPADVVLVAARGGPPLAVTSPARTCADLLRTLPEPLALDAAAGLAARTGVAPAAVASCLDAMPRARGVARARHMLQRWPGPGSTCEAPGSPGEAAGSADDAAGRARAPSVSQGGTPGSVDEASGAPGP